MRLRTASQVAAATVPEADSARESLPSPSAGARRGSDVTSPPPPPRSSKREGVGKEAVIHRRSRPQLSNSAARCLDKSRQTWLLPGPLSSPRASQPASLWDSSFARDGSLRRWGHLGPGSAGGSHSGWGHAEEPREEAKLWDLRPQDF